MAVITLYADASFCPKTRAAGGAYEIMCGNTRIRDRFELPDLKDSWEAEVLTYGRALYDLMRHPKLKKYLRKGATLVAVLDCEGVGTFVNSDKSHSVKGRKFRTGTLSVREVHKLITVYTETKVVFEHVKAHTDATTIAAFYNSRVDENAKLVMLNLRGKIHKHNNLKKLSK